MALRVDTALSITTVYVDTVPLMCIYEVKEQILVKLKVVKSLPIMGAEGGVKVTIVGGRGTKTETRITNP